MIVDVFFLLANVVDSLSLMKKDMQVLGFRSQRTGFIIQTQALSAYEKYITFAFIELKAAKLCFVRKTSSNGG